MLSESLYELTKVKIFKIKKTYYTLHDINNDHPFITQMLYIYIYYLV